MSTPGDNGKAVFVCHSSQDADEARRVVTSLEARGVPCWFAPRDIAPGREYGEEIIEAIEKCGTLLVVLSGHANGSRHVANEVSRAFSREKTIIPFRIQDVQPSKALELFVSSTHWVDAWQGGWEEKVDQVAAAARSKRPAMVHRGPAHATERPRPAARLIAVAAVAVFCVGLAFLSWVKFAGGGAETGSTYRADVDGPESPAPGGSADIRAATLPRYRAVVVGVNAYAQGDEGGWNLLKTARQDAEAVATALERDFGFTVRRLFDGEATRAAVMTALDEIVGYGDDDAVLVYFAGHGYYDAAMEEGYWIPADARRKVAGRDAKEDWLWNSTITRIVGASAARHVLVLADACYSGSLFRGDAPMDARGSLSWYERALARPSRYLIASGGLEPVLDSGAGHSVFAQQVLNFLGDPEQDVFSASDLGAALRGRVSALTGQMVQMGPLPLARHAGGEFVFVRKDADVRLAAAPAAPEIGAAAAPADAPGLLRDALALSRDGAPNAAGSLVSLILGQEADDMLARAVAEHLDGERRGQKRDELRTLIQTLEQRRAAGKEAGGETGAARPRIVACLGPVVRDGGAGAESLALLYRIGLRAAVESAGRVMVIEREAIEDVLQEMALGASDLADPKARTAIGKLLPASLLLLGDVLPAGDGEKIYLRLVDTETTRVLASFSATRAADGDHDAVCAELAKQVSERAVALKPLVARVTQVKGDRIRASAGRFHGAGKDTRFEVIRRVPVAEKTPEDFREEKVGEALVAEVDTLSCELVAAWNDPTRKPAARGLWVREQPAP